MHRQVLRTHRFHLKLCPVAKSVRCRFVLASSTPVTSTILKKSMWRMKADRKDINKKHRRWKRQIHWRKRPNDCCMWRKKLYCWGFNHLVEASGSSVKTALCIYTVVWFLRLNDNINEMCAVHRWGLLSREEIKRTTGSGKRKEIQGVTAKGESLRESRGAK